MYSCESTRLGITTTKRCRVQSSFKTFDTLDALPFIPTKPIRSRGGIYIKYFATIEAAGTFWIRGDAIGDFPGTATGYPITRLVGDDQSKKARRSKQIFLPITGRVRLFVACEGNIEGASTLEIA